MWTTHDENLQNMCEKPLTNEGVFRQNIMLTTVYTYIDTHIDFKAKFPVSYSFAVPLFPSFPVPLYDA